MPIGRALFVPGFSRCTRRTAGAQYRPDLNRSSSPDRFASNSASYCAAVTPSTGEATRLDAYANTAVKRDRSSWHALPDDPAPEPRPSPLAMQKLKEKK